MKLPPLPCRHRAEVTAAFVFFKIVVATAAALLCCHRRMPPPRYCRRPAASLPTAATQLLCCLPPLRQHCTATALAAPLPRFINKGGSYQPCRGPLITQMIGCNCSSSLLCFNLIYKCLGLILGVFSSQPCVQFIAVGGKCCWWERLLFPVAVS